MSFNQSRPNDSVQYRSKSGRSTGYNNHRANPGGHGKGGPPAPSPSLSSAAGSRRLKEIDEEYNDSLDDIVDVAPLNVEWVNDNEENDEDQSYDPASDDEICDEDETDGPSESDFASEPFNEEMFEAIHVKALEDNTSHAGEEAEASQHSEYADSSDEVITPRSSDDELNDWKKKKQKGKAYHPHGIHGEDAFCIGMRFEGPKQFKLAVQEYAIVNGKDIEWLRSNQKRMEAKCHNNCPWRIYASWNQQRIFEVKVYENIHKGCFRLPRNRQCTAEWIARHYIERYRENHEWDVNETRSLLDASYGIKVSLGTCYRARRLANEEITGSLDDHYNRISFYVAELKRVNRKSLFDVMVERPLPDSEATFKRMYVGFEGLRDGFLRGCRHVISLDGCFLKTHVGGQLLSAVGRDGNNQMFPIAWAVVEGENQASWSWFLGHLRQDLNIDTGFGWTVISDQQKGLQNAVMALMPMIEHRNCARHIYANWKKKHNTYVLKRVFWAAVMSNTEAEFKRHMDEMKMISPQAMQDFMNVGVEKFCRCKINTSTSCEVIDNNLSECFNSYILRARSKSIIDMLEDIRKSLMRRLSTKQELIERYEDILPPRIRKRVEFYKTLSNHCKATHAGGHRLFEVQYYADQYVVDMTTRTCTCRGWQLRGIPCQHAIPCIYWLGLAVEDHVVHYLRTPAWKSTYESFIHPINGRSMWPSGHCERIMPPQIKSKPGRPKKVRRKDKDETDRSANTSRLSKKGNQMKCSNCHTYGHNKKSCKAARPEPRSHTTMQEGSKSASHHGASTNASHNQTQMRPKHSVKRRPASQPNTSAISSQVHTPEHASGYGVTHNTESGVIYTRVPAQHTRSVHIRDAQFQVRNSSGPRRFGMNDSG